MVEYAYDAWGNVVSISGNMASSLGADNPFRYRGYYYDNETGLYYLNQRYYNPEWGRFINADSFGGNVGKLLSHNVFAYCVNNPIMFSDPSGNREIIGSGDLREEADLRGLLKLQKLLNNKEYDKINQGDYRARLYGGTIEKNGCGMIAAIIAVSKSGKHVDVIGAYEYFKQPKYEFIGGSIKPGAVESYINKNGVGTLSALPSSIFVPIRKNSKYISVYHWTDPNEPKNNNWHYQFIETDSNGGAISYNGLYSGQSYSEVLDANNRNFEIFRIRIY